jgi:formate hydrogenlyase subunit 3/multisubunit Na+/H+ antiporter MnhD subunit
MPAPHLNQDERGRLWAFIVVPPFFGVVGIGLPLTSTSVDGDEWGKVGLILGSLAFLGIWVTAISKPLLKELARRGEWVPPGTTRYPVLVALAIPVLILAALGAVVGVEIWVMRLCGLVS